LQTGSLGNSELKLLDKRRGEALKLRSLLATYFGYRLILGRKPENVRVLLKKSSESIQEIGIEFLESYESRIKNRSIHPPMIESHEINSISNLEFDGHFKKVVSQWGNLGETDPYWSVLSSKQFSGPISFENNQLFEKTGQDTISNLVKICAVNKIDFPEEMRVLEIGCGVGRLTAPLSHMFHEVTAIDISKGNLDLAKERLKNSRNISFSLVRSIEDIEFLENNFNLMVSLITFQHNPPEVQKLMLERLLEKFDPNFGIGYFQFVTYIAPRGLENSKAFNNDSFDTYAFPMNSILKIINKHGFSLFEFYRDDFQQDSDFHSYSFFIIKRNRFN
jgi:SAM-dependent methyltransferase